MRAKTDIAAAAARRTDDVMAFTHLLLKSLAMMFDISQWGQRYPPSFRGRRPFLANQNRDPYKL